MKHTDMPECTDHPTGRHGKKSGLPNLSNFSLFQAQGEMVLT